MDTHTHTITWTEWNEAEAARGIAADIEAIVGSFEDAELWRDRDKVAAYVKPYRMGPLTKYKVTIKVEEEKE